MSSNIDPTKLKLEELRAELTNRGLDAKGNKAAMIKRLKDALDKEPKAAAKTAPAKKDVKTAPVVAKTESPDVKGNPKTAKIAEKPKPVVKAPDKPKPANVKAAVKAPVPAKSVKVETKTPAAKTVKPEPKKLEAETTESPAKKLKVVKNENVAVEKSSEMEEPKITLENDEAEVEAVVAEAVGVEAVAVEAVGVEAEGVEAIAEDEGDDETEDAEGKNDEPEQKGEKRKRSVSPDEDSQTRSQTPIKEDEPDYDVDQVLLSWCDSDLYLDIDKETLLSAKPLVDGALGYAWSGARATHGVSSGKVCYEVKITEELKCEDISKYIIYPKKFDNRKNRYQRKGDKKYNDRNNTSKTGNDKNKNPTDKNKKPDVKEKEKSTETVEENEEDVVDKDTTEEPQDEAEEAVEESEVEIAEEPQEKKPEDCDNVQTEEPMETDASEDGKKLKDDQSKNESAKKPTSVESLSTHFLRVGWSLLSCGLQLGEEKFSYGYDSSGKFVTNKQFVDYGVQYGVGDVVGAFLEIDDNNVTIQYTLNGEVQPVATIIQLSELPEENFALFPHIISRHYAFEVNFGDREEPWFAIPEELEGYSYLSEIEGKISGPLRPETREECEVILMCGLPGAGKSHWVRRHVSNHPEKAYNVLGTANLLDRMTVEGESLKSKYKDKWQSLVDRMKQGFNKIISVASTRRRNYIIDQTNVFVSAQRRNLRAFKGFKRSAVVVIVGDEELSRRQFIQEIQEGKEVSEKTILSMKAAMAIPQKGDYLDEVSFVGVEESKAKELVEKYNAAGKKAGYGYERRPKGNNRNKNTDGRRNYNKNQPQSNYRNSQRSRGGDNNSSGNWKRDRDRQVNRGPPNRDRRGNDRDRRGGDRRDNRNQGYNRNFGGQGGGRNQSWSGGSGGWGNRGWNQQQSFGNRGFSIPVWGTGNIGGSGPSPWQNGGGFGGVGGGGQGYGGGYRSWNY